MERLGKYSFEKYKKVKFDILYFSNKPLFVIISTILTLIIIVFANFVFSSSISNVDDLSTSQVAYRWNIEENNHIVVDDFSTKMNNNYGGAEQDITLSKHKCYRLATMSNSSDCVTCSSMPQNDNECKINNTKIRYERGCFADSDNSSVVMDRKSRQVLYGQNIHLSMGMASTTKIMTALVALENCKLDKLVKIPKEAVGVEGSSIYLKENEVWSVQDLLYGLMLRSGNDAATALAIEAGGSVDNFVDMMNERAMSMGLENTHFTNPHGLNESGHFTSGYDLALIACDALENNDFANIVSAKSYVVQANETHPKVVFVNKNKMLGMFEGCDGVKTGYTKATGKCLVSSATRGDMSLVCVTLNNPNMWQESMNSLQKAFDMYKSVKVIDKNQDLFVLTSGGKSYRFRVEKDINIAFKKDENIEIDCRIDCTNFSSDKTNSVDKMQNVGKVYIKFDNRLIFCQNISSIDSIKDKGIIKLLPNVVGGGCLENWYGKT